MYHRVINSFFYLMCWIFKKKMPNFFGQWMYHSNYSDDEKELLLPWFIGSSELLGHAWAVFSFIFIFPFVMLY